VQLAAQLRDRAALPALDALAPHAARQPAPAHASQRLRVCHVRGTALGSCTTWQSLTLASHTERSCCTMHSCHCRRPRLTTSWMVPPVMVMAVWGQAQERHVRHQRPAHDSATKQAHHNIIPARGSEPGSIRLRWSSGAAQGRQLVGMGNGMGEGDQGYRGDADHAGAAGRAQMSALPQSMSVTSSPSASAAASACSSHTSCARPASAYRRQP